MIIYCHGCTSEVEARLTNGAEIYPHRPDLATLPFWKCDTCGNYVGCHHLTDDPTRPKGNIATPEVRAWRLRLHQKIDPLWKHGGRKLRQRVYALMSGELGYTYHSGDVGTQEQFDQSINAANRVSKKLRRGGK